jgi:hypothetical protein
VRIRRSGFTLVEAVVMLAVTGVVLGLILDALIQTDRSSRELVDHQQMRQEALVIAANIEKLARYRVSPPQLAQAGAPAGAEGPAEDIPHSLSVTGITTAVLERAAETSPTATSTTDSPTTVTRMTDMDTTTMPPSVRTLFTTGTVQQPAEDPAANPAEAFAPGSMTLATLAAGTEPHQLLQQIENDGQNRLVLRNVASGAFRTIGLQPDKFQATVSFRYAEHFDGLQPAYNPTASAPKLVEYTIRVWPRSERYPRFEQAIADGGRVVNFSLTSAMVLP